MPHSQELRDIGSAIHLRRGAQNAIKDCLSVTTDDRVLIIFDKETQKIGAAIAAAVTDVGAPFQAFNLDKVAPRPLTILPGNITRAMGNCTVSLYIVRSQDGERPHRNQLLEMVEPNRIRHAHMLDISEDSLCQGMLSDYRKIAKLNPVVIDRISRAKSIRVTSPVGTDVTVTLSPTERWESSAGIISPGEWNNLPNGEILICPTSVDGVFVCDNLAPSRLDIDRFELGRKPPKLFIEKGRVVNVEGGPGDLAKDIMANSRAGTNTDRIGQFAVGTNYDLLMPLGDRLQDMFVPGAYFSLGRPMSSLANPSWTASDSYVFMGRKTTLELDGTPIITLGRYDTTILTLAT